MDEPATITELQDAVRGADKILPVGGRTKPALSDGHGEHWLSMRGLRGIVRYDPGEYTFTALAGTPLAEIEAALAEHGQYLPFEPPFAARGSTLGGMVASGLNGPGSHRYGGIRDFILGLRFLTGDGRLIRGGGAVVKNAAGFDLPKFMVGSAGRWGVLIELTFKVFPKPEGELSLAFAADLAPDGLDDCDALEFDPEGARRIARFRGDPGVLCARLAKIPSAQPMAADYWRDRADFTWASREPALAKAPITPEEINGFEAAIGGTRARRLYSIGGHVAWVAGADEVLQALDRPLLRLRSARPCDPPAFPEAARLRPVFDPVGRFFG